jgi:hypothetical protein
MSEESPKHWSQTGGVKNLTFEAIAPRPPAQGWICTLCDAANMVLLPVSHDENPLFWQCSNCNRQITMEERDQVFEAVKQNVKEKYLLHSLNFDRDNNRWTIISGEWRGESRIGAKRRTFSSAVREDLIEELLSSLEATLNIHFGTTRDYFLED